jgi:hypothetical protein
VRHTSQRKLHCTILRTARLYAEGSNEERQSLAEFGEMYYDVRCNWNVSADGI